MDAPVVQRQLLRRKIKTAYHEKQGQPAQILMLFEKIDQSVPSQFAIY